jgi:hypothetical protein
MRFDKKERGAVKVSKNKIKKEQNHEKTGRNPDGSPDARRHRRLHHEACG